ncbi:hypothetical protein HUJ04_011025 [Dendroctonus ponderosae]|nr:hypothetical protein HUJ04_011025 [Dendroctonus ponderosae]KAH1028265.1 hypothetical protein HUJ05_001639 [Dendroctonus ponderosae]
MDSFHCFDNVKYDSYMKSFSYSTHMQLNIDNVAQPDYGNYKCVAKNSLGETDGTIQVFKIPKPSSLTEHISIVEICMVSVDSLTNLPKNP